MNSELLTSIENQTLVHFRHFRHFSSLLTIFPSTLVERSLQISSFLTNKANFRKSQMNVSSFITMNYEQRTMNDEIKNKPNSNPIQTQYKPNSKPIQSQYKPNTKPICRGVASGEAGTNPISEPKNAAPPFLLWDVLRRKL